jgi:hypothetical protein
VKRVAWGVLAVGSVIIGTAVGFGSESSVAAPGVASPEVVAVERPWVVEPGLEREAAERGRVRVIVLFDTPVRPELELPELGLTAQRVAVAADRAVVNWALRGTGSTVVRQFRYVPGLVVSATPQGLEALSRSAAVSSVEREAVVEPLLAESTDIVEADEMWNSDPAYRGTGQTIAVLDSGIDADHPMLQRINYPSISTRVKAGACFSTTDASQGFSTICPGGGTSETGVEAAWDCGDISGCYHGTHVAGIAAGRANASTSAGVAPDADLISVQVFTKRTQGCPPGLSECITAVAGDLLAGLEYVYDLRETYNIAAVNMSLGGGLYTACPTYLSTIIANLKAADIATVIATGNGDGNGAGRNNGVAFPACDPGAIAVSATTDGDLVTEFADTHPTLVDLYAPGKDIYSAMPDGSYASLSGTSMAAPHVAGAWALLRQALGTGGDRGVDDILARLQKTGTPVTTREAHSNLDLGLPEENLGFSRPRINIKQAFDAQVLSVSVSGDGSVASDPAGVSCPDDCAEVFANDPDVTLSATPTSGASFVGWSGDCSGLTTCVVSMTQARSVSAKFARVPGAPTGVSGVRGDGEVTVSWSAPSDDGGDAISGYTVTASPGGATCGWSTGPLSCTVSGLTNGTAYTFTVTATNAVGTGSASLASAAVTPGRVPGAPTGVSGVFGDGQVTVSWSAPADTGGYPVTGYTVTASPGAATCSWTTGPLSCTVTGLTNGTRYTFTVNATNTVGTGSASTPSSSVFAARVGGAPTGVSGVPGDGQVTVSWSAPADAGSPAFEYYEVTASPDGKTCQWTFGSLSCTVTGLTNGTAYTFTVRTENEDYGFSAPSSPSAPVTPGRVAGAPTGVSGVRGDGQVTVSWSAPTNTGDPDLTGYTVTASPDGKTCQWTFGSPSCTVLGLTNGTAYTFTVAATNSAGAGPASTASGAVTPVASVTVPGVPTGVSGVAGDSEVVVSWTAPVSDGGSVISSYTVTSSPDNKTCSTTGLSCTVVRLTNATAYTFTVAATNTAGAGLASTASGAVTPVASLVALTPSRLLETRSGLNDLTVDGFFQGIGRRGAGTTLQLTVTGRGGVPNNAGAVMLNVTAVSPSAPGFLTVFPCGTEMPLASSVNYGPGDVVANAVLAKIGTGGKVCIYSPAATDIVVDVTGYIAAGSLFGTVVPGRLLDTRSGLNDLTVDGFFQGIGRRGAGTTLELTVTGRGGVPNNAGAVMLNVTAVSPSAAGFLTVFPCGTEMPLASSVNYGPGDVVANAVLAKIGTGGKVCIYSPAATDIVVDVTGYIAAGSLFGTVVPGRLLETRSGLYDLTVDGFFQGNGRRGAGTTLELTVTGRGGVPNNAGAVMLNVTAVSPGAPGFLTVFPCGTTMPLASSVNYGPGDVVANAVLAKIGAGGKVCIYSPAATDIVVDVTGYIPAG